MKSTDKIVYISGQGAQGGKGVKSSTGKQNKKKEQAQNNPKNLMDGIVRVARETKGRKGKGVTLITGLPLDQCNEISKELKKKCGCGGTVKAGIVEVQTDQRDFIVDLLKAKGFQVKKAGG